MVRGVEPDHRIGMPDSLFGGAMTDHPRSARLLGCEGRLSHNIGDFKRRRYARAEPIRRLMVKMVSKPQLGSRHRRLAIAAQASISEPPTEDGEPRLALTVTASFKAAKSGGQHRFVPGQPQGL